MMAKTWEKTKYCMQALTSFLYWSLFNDIIVTCTFHLFNITGPSSLKLVYAKSLIKDHGFWFLHNRARSTVASNSSVSWGLSLNTRVSGRYDKLDFIYFKKRIEIILGDIHRLLKTIKLEKESQDNKIPIYDKWQKSI